MYHNYSPNMLAAMVLFWYFHCNVFAYDDNELVSIGNYYINPMEKLFGAMSPIAHYGSVMVMFTGLVSVFFILAAVAACKYWLQCIALLLMWWHTHSHKKRKLIENHG